MSVTGGNQRRLRLSGEDGFTMLIALGVLAVTALLLAAVWIAVDGDVHQNQHDLDAKRAYFAASAGVNAFLYQLNQNPDYWDTCANDSQSATAVPGSTTGEEYSYAPILANGASACGTPSVISSLIDDSSGSLRIKFTGYAGGSPQVQRGIVAGFREKTPFDFLWYTVYEALDSTLSGYSGCNVFYRNSRNSACNINWVSGDSVNGPMYTEDQYLVASGNSPTFGRNSGDAIESSAPGTASSDICANDNCQNADIKGNAQAGVNPIPPPTTNSFLETDAANNGQVYTGTTTIQLNNTTATVTNCPSSCTTSTVDLTKYPIIYVQNGSGCSPTSYTPYFNPSTSRPGYGSEPSGDATGCAGDVYVSGTYTTPLTIGAADDIIIDGNLQTTESSGTPTGTATLGLVANEFVRVMHGVSGYGETNNQITCSSTASQTLDNLKIDAAILAVQHSFIVDNYLCGGQLGTLTVNGAIAQYFRGTVGATQGTGSSATTSGYIKNYTYDDRLKYLLPPYLFDVSNAGWELSRETTCVPGGSDPNTQC